MKYTIIIHRVLNTYINIISIIKKEIELWEENTLNTYLNSDVYDYNGTSYWYLEEYSIILVKRDKERFKEIRKGIDSFWSDVLKHREIGYEMLVKTKEKNMKRNH